MIAWKNKLDENMISKAAIASGLIIIYFVLLYLMHERSAANFGRMDKPRGDLSLPNEILLPSRVQRQTGQFINRRPVQRPQAQSQPGGLFSFNRQPERISPGVSMFDQRAPGFPPDAVVPELNERPAAPNWDTLGQPSLEMVNEEPQADPFNMMVPLQDPIQNANPQPGIQNQDWRQRWEEMKAKRQRPAPNNPFGMTQLGDIIENKVNMRPAGLHLPPLLNGPLEEPNKPVLTERPILNLNDPFGISKIDGSSAKEVHQIPGMLPQMEVLPKKTSTTNLPSQTDKLNSVMFPEKLAIKSPAQMERIEDSRRVELFPEKPVAIPSNAMAKWDDSPQIAGDKPGAGMIDWRQKWEESNMPALPGLPEKPPEETINWMEKWEEAKKGTFDVKSAIPDASSLMDKKPQVSKPVDHKKPMYEQGEKTYINPELVPKYGRDTFVQKPVKMEQSATSQRSAAEVKSANVDLLVQKPEFVGKKPVMVAPKVEQSNTDSSWQERSSTYLNKIGEWKPGNKYQQTCTLEGKSVIAECCGTNIKKLHFEFLDQTVQNDKSALITFLSKVKGKNVVIMGDSIQKNFFIGFAELFQLGMPVVLLVILCQVISTMSQLFICLHILSLSLQVTK